MIAFRDFRSKPLRGRASKRSGLLALTLFATVASGCHVTGPASVKTGRAMYNVAVQQTDKEQLLLNIVRLRYRDTPYFMEVASVSTSFDFAASASAGVSLPEAAANGYDVGTGIGYAEKPTVTYTPVKGDRFATQLMTPVGLDTLLLLYHSGWSIERIFRVLLQSVNGVKNAPSASGPTPDRVPEYKGFREVGTLLRALQVKGTLELGLAGAGDGGKPAVELQIAESAARSDEMARLCDLLGLEPGRTRFTVTTEVGLGGGDRIAVVPRSLMASLFYISQSVEPPPGDEVSGRVTVTRDPRGERFDWQEVTGGLMRIRSSDERPREAYSAVRYRDAWFYIDDSDLTSKSSFSLLTQLFSLQEGEVKSAGPFLTLPIR